MCGLVERPFRHGEVSRREIQVHDECTSLSTPIVVTWSMLHQIYPGGGEPFVLTNRDIQKSKTGGTADALIGVEGKAETIKQCPSMRRVVV